MAKFDTKSIINLALLGQGGSGKTSLAEALIYITGGSDRLGKVADGNTVCDYDAEEIKRGFTLSASVVPVEWKNIKINIIDTPGYLDFVGEANQALRVAGSAVITVDAKAGVEVGTELAWNSATAYGVPKVFFVNKCDDNEANFDRVFKELDYKFGRTVCPVFVPVEYGKDVTMLDLVAMKAYKYDSCGKRWEIPMEARFEEVVAQYKEALNEALAGTSDELMEKYFNGEEITKEEAVEALHQGIIDGTITPVYCGSATNVWGVIAMLDAISESFPRFTAKKNEKLDDGTLLPIEVDGDPSVFVFKTVADQFVGKMSFFKCMSGTLKRDAVLKNNRSGVAEKFAHIYTVKGKNQVEVDELACGDIGMVAKLSDTDTNDTLSVDGTRAYLPIKYPKPYYTQAMAPAAKGDEGKISQGIAKLLEEDLTINYENNAETKQMLISGLGDMHLANLVAKLKARFGVSVNLSEPKLAYREKITKKVQVEGKHKKQSGGSGQYGHVKITFSPGEAEGLTFTESVVGGAVPKNYFPAVEKGLQEAMTKGVAGFPVIHLAADLFDGSYHDVDSNEISFKLAANLAYKECLKQAAPVLLEPVGDLTVTIPDDLVGDIMGDLNKRRGSVMGMDTAEMQGYTTINAIAPKAELTEYPIVLRAMTQGRGSFDFEVTGYEVVPGNIAAKIVEDYKKSQEG
ncbi:MAG: elongation factor G [Clostridia bacterium]|nr:elongation factor G [Clostridia bacterium]